eukprot:365440-Chlamydomonas_euryale.AAC.2
MSAAGVTGWNPKCLGETCSPCRTGTSVQEDRQALSAAAPGPTGPPVGHPVQSLAHADVEGDL